MRLGKPINIEECTDRINSDLNRAVFNDDKPPKGIDLYHDFLYMVCTFIEGHISGELEYEIG